MICDDVDFAYPFLADIYYSTISQGVYNEITKTWDFDRTIPFYASAFINRMNKDEVNKDYYAQYNQHITARSRSDIRMSSENIENAMTNIIITNIRNPDGTIIFKETSGIRSGSGTLYEISAFQPFVGAFGDIEYYGIVLRRTENQNLEVVGS